MRAILIAFTLFCVSIPSLARRLPTLIPYQDNGKFGYCDSNGVVKIKPRWGYADFFCGKKAVTGDSVGESSLLYFNLIDTNGNYIIPPARHWNGKWNGKRFTGLNAHNDAGKYGLIDTNNQVIIPFEYDKPEYDDYYFYDTVYRILSKNGRRGVFDSTGKEVLPFIYDGIRFERATEDMSAYFQVSLKGRMGIFSVSGQEIVPIAYDEIWKNYSFNKTVNCRKGFYLKNRLAESDERYKKGKRFLIGWKDYPPGAKFISPQFTDFRFVSDNLYIADDQLFTADDKRLLPQLFYFKYHGDTLMGRMALPHTKDSLRWQQYFYDINALQPLGNRREGSKIFGRNRYYGGIAEGRASRDFDDGFDADIPKININGERVKDFMRDSIQWFTSHNCFESIVLCGGAKNGTQYKVAADSWGNFLFRPLKSDDGIAYVNIPDSLLILRRIEKERRSYAVISFGGDTIVPFQNLFIMSATRKWGGITLMVSYNNEEVRYGRKRNSNDNFEIVGRGIHVNINMAGRIITTEQARLYDVQMQPIERFQAYYYVMYNAVYIDSSDSKKQAIYMRDGFGKVGWLDWQGNILHPAISFKYYSISTIANNCLLGGGSLLDTNNNNLLPGYGLLQMKAYGYPLQGYTRDGGCFVPAREELNEIKKLYYYTGGKERFFYLAGNDRIYTGRP